MVAATASAASAMPVFTAPSWLGWEGASAQSGATGSVELSFMPAGPTTGEGLRVLSRTGDSASFYGIALNPLFSYDPAQGAIGSVTYSYLRDGAFWVPNGTCSGVALLQAGALFVSQPATCEIGIRGETMGPITATAGQFDDFPGTADPDFSTAGAPITFGVYVLQSGAQRTALTEFKTLTLTLNPVAASPTAVAMPEPAGAGLVLAGLGAVAALRRRRAVAAA